MNREEVLRAVREDEQLTTEQCIYCSKTLPVGQRLECYQERTDIFVAGAICKACLKRALKDVRREYPRARGQLISMLGRPIE